MAQRKSERIVNLTIALLSARRFVTREHLREAVEGYAGLSDAAFERTFERDKDELRAMGVPIETGSNSVLFDDDYGYRIPRSDFELAPIEFTADEAAVVALAGETWEQANLAASTRRALIKLSDAGVQPRGALEGLNGITRTPLSAREPAFEPMWNAVLSRSRVEFFYRDGQRRRLEPWVITSAKGRWYVTGYDLDRQAPRIFRLSRINDLPEVVAGPGAFEVPPDVDPRAVAKSLEPPTPRASAVLAIRRDAAPTLRRQGEEIETATADDGASWQASGEFTVYRVGYADQATFVGEVCSHGPDVIVVEPADLRDAVVEQLRWVASSGPLEVAR